MMFGRQATHICFLTGKRKFYIEHLSGLERVRGVCISHLCILKQCSWILCNEND